MTATEIKAANLLPTFFDNLYNRFKEQKEPLLQINQKSETLP